MPKKKIVLRPRGRLGFNVKHKMGERSYLGVNALLNVLESSDFFILEKCPEGYL